MTPPARAQAAIDILDQVIASTKTDGAPADVLVTRYFKTRRYAGSKDRRAVRELVFQAIRNAIAPTDGRSSLLTVEGMSELFDGSVHAPAALGEGEVPALTGIVPDWLVPELSPLVGPDEITALALRAPLDLRINAIKTTRDDMIAAFPEAAATPLSSLGLRLPAGTRVDDHPAFAQGLVEVQDEGSQLIAFACGLSDGESAVDLCAGAGGKALAMAAGAPQATILATDTNRARLSQLGPRAERAGATIVTRLLNPPNETEELADMAAATDCVLVDAPCSGTGTWRRNPEGRWRLTPDRLDRLTATQAHLLDIAAPLVKPGGRLVFAVCSILSREGSAQIADFLRRHSSWIRDDMPIAGGRAEGDGRLLTPGHDATDGFFVARLKRSC
ncbi:MAG: RsmB/NOP family class I SAM-dependent RNA methyltransferase [Sphingomicrobium sp.]